VTARLTARHSSPATPARTQNFGLGLTTQDSNKPITIEADQGIEWQQNNRVYIARGHAKATRGQATVFGDVLVAYYRPVAQPGAGASAPPPEHKAAPGASSDPIGGNSTEIYRLEATGNVRIATETQTVYGDHAVYDVDRTLLVVTGKNLHLETPRDTLTARDSLEWYDDKQLAVARGDVVRIDRQDLLVFLKGEIVTPGVVITIGIGQQLFYFLNFFDELRTYCLVEVAGLLQMRKQLQRRSAIWIVMLF